MSDQGWFESDDDYRNRVAQEANENTIEDTSGSAPSQGLFEDNDDYRDRIEQEANEHRIEEVTGSSPSQGWFEDNDNYRDRVEQEANERTIEDLTGSSPSQGLFESDNDYGVRARREANEELINHGENSLPRQRWFESNHDYRSRLAHEARQVRAQGRKNGGKQRESQSGQNDIKSIESVVDGGNTGLKIVIVSVVVLVVVMFATVQENTTLKSVDESNSTVKMTDRLETIRQARLDAKQASLNQFDFYEWPIGHVFSLPSKSMIKFCTRLCSSGRSKGVKISLLSITRNATGSITLNLQAKVDPKLVKKALGSSFNNHNSEYLLFVSENSYLTDIPGIKTLYGEAIHLINAEGKKYKALDGIQGLNLKGFNKHARKALLPYDGFSHFHINFPIPAGVSESLTVVFPSLRGHSRKWKLDVYNVNM